MECEDIRQMDWPGWSPGNTWDSVERAVAIRFRPPRTTRFWKQRCWRTRINRTGSHKRPGFQYKFSFRYLHNCKRWSYLISFFFNTVSWVLYLPTLMNFMHDHACIYNHWMVIFFYYIRLCTYLILWKSVQYFWR